MDNEKLKEIKALHDISKGHTYNNHLGYQDIEWLIEQAEKVEKLQDDIKQLNALLDGTNNIIERQIAEARCQGE